MAKVRLNVALNTVYRGYEERFLVNTSSTEAWNVETDLENHVAASATLAPSIWEAVETRRAEGGVPGAHFDIWLENVTHPTPGAGVVVLPKGNITGRLNDEELTDVSVIVAHLHDYVALLKHSAGY